MWSDGGVRGFSVAQYDMVGERFLSTLICAFFTFLYIFFYFGNNILTLICCKVNYSSTELRTCLAIALLLKFRLSPSRVYIIPQPPTVFAVVRKSSMSHAIDIDNKIDDDNYNSQCWKDIEAETGHKTYLSHLKNLPKRRPQLDRLASTLREADDPDTSIGGVQVLILDLLQDGNISTSLKIQCIGNEADQEYFVRKSSTQILENLRSPPESVPARIVLWLLQREVNPPPQIVDAVGLGLNLHPSILESVLQFVKLSTRERKPDGLNCVTIGDRVATIVRDYRPQGYSPPVLLIGGLFDFNYSSYIIPRGLNSTYDEFVRDTLEEEMGGDTSFGPFSAIDEVPGDRLTVLSLNYWLKLLDSCDQNDRSADLQGTNRLLTYMMQLIHIEILRLRIQCDCLQWQIRGVRFLTELQEFVLDDIREKNYRWLDEHRFWLRRRLEGLRESRDRFVRFTRSQGGTEWLKETEWLSLNEDVTEAIAHARLYDTEARDVMQHMTANLSIIESRKSIHVSNRQMDEAKRGKRHDCIDLCKT